MRRESTITSAPSAPYAMSCHMNPNRSCPGVPNRYSFSSWSMVMQPKSRATVVVVFAGTCPVRSISAATEVIAASVVSGGISEMTDTAVVLPTPKPPAMTILTGTGGRGAPETGSAYGFESTDHSFDQVRVLGLGEAGTADDEVPGRGEVRDEYPGHADVHPQFRGHLGDGERGRAERDDVAVLEGQPLVRGHARLAGHDLSLDLEGQVDRLHPSGGEQVRPQRGDAATVRKGGVAVVPHGQVRALGRRFVGLVGRQRHVSARC